MNIALIRHGHTAGNLRRAYVGSTDQPLCPKGKDRIATIKEAGLFPEVELVYSSPMLRCIETAEIIYPHMAAKKIQDLRERDFGRFEGMTHDEITALPGYAEWGMDPQGMVFPEGEEWTEFSSRCVAAFSRVVGETLEKSCDTAAVICHGGTIMAIMEGFVLSDKPYHHWMCGHGCGYLLSLDRIDRSAVVAGSIGL